MGYLVTLMGTWLLRFFGAGASAWLCKWLALFFVSALLLQGYNFIVDLYHEISIAVSALQNSAVSDSGLGSVSGISLTGLAGYLAHHLRLVECFAFISNVVLLKVILRIFPLSWL